MMKKLTTICLLIVTIFTVKAQHNTLRKVVGTHQLDSRFTFSIEKYWSGIADEEVYYFYLKNNTADEYLVEIEYDLTLNCYDVIPRRVESRLKPYAEKEYYQQCMITSDKEKQKDCLILEGNTPTLYRTHYWKILRVENITQKERQKAELEQKAKEEADKKAKEIEAKKKAEEIQKKIQEQKQIQNTEVEKTKNTANTNAANNNLPTNNGNQGNSVLSEKVMVNGQYVQVFKQGGKYYMVNADGSQHNTTQQAYDVVQQASNKKTANFQNSGSSNPLSTPTTETTSQIPSLESQYEKLGIPVNTPTYTKSEITTQVVTQAAGVIGGLLDDWNAASERKQKIREIENDEKWDRIHQRARNRFEFYYNQLINLATSGDENAQMILYLESDGDYVDDDLVKAVPLRSEWYKKALENNSTIALLTKINTSYSDTYYENKELLHKLADEGNIDAMVMLGLWYSQRPNRPSYFYKRSIYDTTHGYMKGGDNQELAIKYFTVAAEKGSPNAMYYLGLIYQEGKISQIYYPIKFKIEKNEKLAFEWFSKSIIPEYKESIYQAHHITNCFFEGSTFTDNSYFKLAAMYEKGKVVPRDLAKAAELRRLGEERYEYIRKIRGFIE